MKKKILITGSNGLLGQKIIFGLLNNNEVEIIATSLGENRMGTLNDMSTFHASSNDS